MLANVRAARPIRSARQRRAEVRLRAILQWRDGCGHEMDEATRQTIILLTKLQVKQMLTAEIKERAAADQSLSHDIETILEELSRWKQPLQVLLV